MDLSDGYGNGSCKDALRSVATPCRAAPLRPVSPTFKSSLPFASPAKDSSFTQSSTKARVLPPKVNRILCEELPSGSNEILDDRGRRHFSPQVPRDRESKKGKVQLCPRDGACSPLARLGSPGRDSPARSMTPGTPRTASPGAAEPPHLSSVGVSSCSKSGDESVLQARATIRTTSPQQLSPVLRSILHEEPLRADETPEPYTARRRRSPRNKELHSPRKAAGTQSGASRLDDDFAAGLTSARRSPVAVDGHGQGCMMAAKEAQIEEDCLQLRRGGSAKLCREHDALLAQPPVSGLPSSELRSMGYAVKEANSRLREQLVQAAKGVPSRSSLKRPKAVSPRLHSPRPGANSPSSARGSAAVASTSPRPNSPPKVRAVAERSAPLARAMERSATAPRSARQASERKELSEVTSATKGGIGGSLRTPRVAVPSPEQPSITSETLPHFGRPRGDNDVEAVRIASLADVSTHVTTAVQCTALRNKAKSDVQRLVTAPSCWPPSRPCSSARVVHLAGGNSASSRAPAIMGDASLRPDAIRTPPVSVTPCTSTAASDAGATSLSADISFSSLGEAVFMSRQTPASGSTCPSETSREGLTQSVQLEEPIEFDMVRIDCGMEGDIAAAFAPQVVSKEHLQKMQIRCHSLLQQATRNSDSPPKRRTSFGGA